MRFSCHIKTNILLKNNFMRLKFVAIILLFTILGGASAIVLSWSNKKPVRHDILIKARQYSYDPAEIAVNYNDTLHINLVSLDAVHGFYIENYDIDAEISPNVKNFKFRQPSKGNNWIDTNEIVFVAKQRGKFRFRCSHTCGNMHPFMQGSLVVKPNIIFNASIGIIIGFVLGLLSIFYIRIFKSSNK